MDGRMGTAVLTCGRGRVAPAEAEKPRSRVMLVNAMGMPRPLLMRCSGDRSAGCTSDTLSGGEAGACAVDGRGRSWVERMASRPSVCVRRSGWRGGGSAAVDVCTERERTVSTEALRASDVQTGAV